MSTKEYLNSIIERLPELLKTQDNLCTGIPLFIVQEKIHLPTSDDYSHKYCWFDINDAEEVRDAEEIEELEKMDEIDIPSNYRKAYYLEHWEFVTACLTRKGCEEYIEANGHNLKEPRIYVESAYKNIEIEAIRNYFMSL